MKYVLILTVLLGVTGCATMRDPNGEDAIESRRRVQAMTAAGTYTGPGSTANEPDYMGQGLINATGYLADKWGTKRQPAAIQGVTECPLVPVTNPVTGMYDLVRQCR